MYGGLNLGRACAGPHKIKVQMGMVSWVLRLKQLLL